MAREPVTGTGPDPSDVDEFTLGFPSDVDDDILGTIVRPLELIPAHETQLRKKL